MPTTTLTTIATFEMKGFRKNHKTVFIIEIFALLQGMIQIILWRCRFHSYNTIFLGIKSQYQNPI